LSDTSSTLPGGDEGGGGDQGGGGDAGGAGQPGDTSAPVPPGLKPFAGTYQFHTTGHASLSGSPQNIDTTDGTLIEDVSDTDQRTTAGSSQGQQVTVLRYSAEKVELVSLELRGAVSKTFNGPVMLSPVPATVGQTWNWSMQSSDSDPTKRTTLTQSSRVDRVETIVVNGQSVDTYVVETDLTFKSSPTDLNGSGHMTTWVSTVYKLSVKNHSTLAGTFATFSFDSDTTSELLDLRPS
jgi:hypothetical protein